MVFILIVLTVIVFIIIVLTVIVFIIIVLTVIVFIPIVLTVIVNFLHLTVIFRSPGLSKKFVLNKEDELKKRPRFNAVSKTAKS